MTLEKLGFGLLPQTWIDDCLHWLKIRLDGTILH